VRGSFAGEEKKKRFDALRLVKRASVLAPETRLKQADDCFLVGDDLRLPHQDDGHYAHSEDAEAENHPGLRLCRGAM